MTREERLREREGEIVHQIEILRAEFSNKAMPLSRELMDLRESRDRRRFHHNGVEYEYTGPMPTYLLPEERAGRGTDREGS